MLSSLLRKTKASASTIRNKWKLNIRGSEESDKRRKDEYLIFSIIVGLAEDVLFWKTKWLSVVFLIMINVLFMIGFYHETNFLSIIVYMILVALSADGLELWLKMHQKSLFLQQLACRDNQQLSSVVVSVNRWLKIQWKSYVQLRDINHTKAFLMINIGMTAIYIIGKCFGGVVIVYLTCMLILTLHLLAPILNTFFIKIRNIAESDGDIDSLVPEVTDKELQMLSVEPDTPIDDRRGLDYEDELPDQDVSDSSESSSSLATNLSMEKLKPIEKGVETSDSSDDEYIPLVQRKDHLVSTLQVQPAETWSGSAMNALYNLAGSVAGMVYTTDKRQPLSRIDSTDGFEIINANEL